MVNIPKLLWSARRQTLFLVALLCNDRASLVAETVDAASGDRAAHAVVWLAQLAKRQQCEEEPFKVGATRWLDQGKSYMDHIGYHIR